MTPDAEMDWLQCAKCGTNIIGRVGEENLCQGCEPLPCDRLELAAWRFLAKRRDGNLSSCFCEFIDGDDGPTIATPEEKGIYAIGVGKTFGAAAVELALTLGMDPNEAPQ